MTVDDAKYVEAKRQVAALRGFYVHVIIFALVMICLLVVNLLTSPVWWVQWPLLGWGLGLLGHAIGVFRPIRLFGRDWEERKIKERLSKM